MRLPFLVAFTILFLAGETRAQEVKDDSLMAEARTSFLLISQNPDSALGLAEKELALAQHTGNQRVKAMAYSTRGWAWLHKGFYDKTFPDLEQAARLFHLVHDRKDEMHVYINTGLAYSNRSQFAKSAHYLFMADSLAQALNDQWTKAEVKREMAILYREQGQYAKAIPNFRASMGMFKAMHDTVHYYGAASSLGALYLKMSRPDSSLVLLQDCLPLIEALHGAGYEKGMLQENFGDAYFDLSRYDKAMESYRRAYTLFLAGHDKADVAYEAMNLGKTFIRLKNYREAENYLLLSYRLDDSLRMANYAHDVAEHLANLFKASGDWRKAYRWQAVRDSLQDSLNLTSLNKKTAELQAQYEADGKEKEIALLKKDQELDRAILQRQKVFQRGTYVVVVLLILIGLLIINRYRGAQKARRLIELEKMRNHIARDLHDDMGSALSSIHIISKVSGTGGMEEQKAQDRLMKIHEHSGLMLENMSDIVWTINPVNDTLEKIIFKMREFAADILDPLNIESVFEQEGDLHNIRLGLQTRKDLYLVFKEALNNAAKYSRCGKVAIRVAADGRDIEVRVRDDGAGFNRNEVKCGNGLKNMEERARQINGQLTISSAPGSGTTVTLRIRSHD
jgi:two-component system sensor histidine kinase UhpB